MILASCGLEKANMYKGSKLYAVCPEDESCSEEVFLNIEIPKGFTDFCFDPNLKVKCYTFEDERDLPSEIPEKEKGNIFLKLTLDDVLDEDGEVDMDFDSDDYPEGVVPLVYLEDGYHDMKELATISDTEDRLRFIGGNLLEIPEVKIGRYDVGKEKMSAVFNGQYDIFTECPLDTLTIETKARKTTVKKRNVSNRATKKEKKVNKKVASFSSFISSFNTVDF